MSTLPRMADLIGRATIDELLRIALGRGAAFADVYAEFSTTCDIVLDEGRLKTLSFGILAGAGVRAVHGEATGYAYADDFDPASLAAAAAAAASVAAAGAPRSPKPLEASRVVPPFVLHAPLPTSRDEAARIEYCRRAEAAARDLDRRVHNVRVVWGDTAKRFLVANSDGVHAEDEQYVTRMMVAVLALEGNRRQTASRRHGGAVDVAVFERRPVEDVAREAAQAAVQLLAAVPAPAGAMPVVIGPGWGGVLVHECFGHSLEGDAIRKRTSIRTSQLGTRVAAPGVFIYDDSTVPWSRGSFAVDDEGTPGQKTLVVEDGILRGYLWDLLNARLSGHASTGNGRRASYRDYPIPRMTNTYIGPGDCDPAEILASVEHGFYCANLGGGSVNPADGNFSFQVTEGYLVDRGQLGAPVANATLTGNGTDAMLRIEMLGRDLVIDTMSGTCGKAGQWKPVGVGQPTVKFRELTVGGSA
jgi:TldD protein